MYGIISPLPEIKFEELFRERNPKLIMLFRLRFRKKGNGNEIFVRRLFCFLVTKRNGVCAILIKETCNFGLFAEKRELLI